jgi:hypothetical protein
VVTTLRKRREKRVKRETNGKNMEASRKDTQPRESMKFTN